MPVTSKVFLQAIALLALIAAISCYPGDQPNTSSSSNGQCPTGMSQFAGSCYGVGNTGVTWYDAQTICQSVGASLAVIDSEAENAYLREISKSTGRSPWIGAVAPFRTNTSNLGSYVWVGAQGNILPLEGEPGFQNWGSEQPNDANGNQRCLFLYLEDGSKWHDYFCYHKTYYICELKLRMPKSF